MSILDDIFKSNTHLLDEPEVQDLVKHFTDRYDKIYKRWKKLDELEGFVLEQCVYSEIVLKQGKDCKETVKAILDYLEGME